MSEDMDKVLEYMEQYVETASCVSSDPQELNAVNRWQQL